MRVDVCSSDPGKLFRCGLVEVVVEDAECFLHHLCLSLNQHQLHRSVNGVFVGSFDRTLFDERSCWNRLCSIRGEAIRSFCG